jgi:hypothetical protein
MRETLKAGVQVVTAPQLFPTPPELAARMVEQADIQPGQRVLEPSVGTGNIAKAIFAAAPVHLENFFVFRGYFHLVLAVSLWWLVLWWMRQQMIAENRDHRAYRQGMTAWFTNLALAGMFVKGGAGYWVFTFSNGVWWWANVAAYTWLILNVAWLAWAMTSNISCLRPDVAYRSKAVGFQCSMAVIAAAGKGNHD